MPGAVRFLFNDHASFVSHLMQGDTVMNRRNGSPDARRVALLALPVAALLGGCVGHMKPVAAHFDGIQQPMMLGSLDRIGGGAPLPVTKAGEFEGEATAVYAQSSNSTSTTTYDAINNLDIYVDAQKALTTAGPGSEIRITTLRNWSKGFISIVKSTVVVEGDVVKVGGAK